MQSLLRHFFKRSASKAEPTKAEPGLVGFTYVADADSGPMRSAAVGELIENSTDGPPWIVVNHSLDVVNIPRWPGRLLKVQVLRPATKQSDRPAGYTRAVSVRILGELPPAQLFGINGDIVAEIAFKATQLGVEDVISLSKAMSPEISALYARAWDVWLSQEQPGSPYEGGEHGRTLALFSGSHASPIGHGFMVIHGAVSRRARELLGDAAFVTDEEGESSLVPEWAAADGALLGAAMGLGASDLLEKEKADILSAPWLKFKGG
jgi:hypothetical protein